MRSLFRTLVILGVLGDGAVAQSSPSHDGNAEAAPEVVYEVGGDVKPPRLVHRVMPEYTDRARRIGIQGTVTIGMIVSSKGEVKAVRVVRGLDSELDGLAVDAVKQWTFKPGTKKNDPVPVKIAVEVSFGVL